MKAINTKIRVLFRYSLVAAVMMLAGACASSKFPAPNTSNAESRVKQAEEAGAQDYAPLELRNARKKVDQAKKLVDLEQYEKATRVTEEATVDAELALTKARSQKAQEAVKQLRETIKTLKQEIQSKQNY